MPAVFNICNDDAVAIANADRTSPDLDEERLDAFLDETGMLADAGIVPKSGWWDSECCKQTQPPGMAHAVEQISEGEPPMDPDAALANMRAALASLGRRRVGDPDHVDDLLAISEAAAALDDWITSGGFLPAAWSTHSAAV